MEGCAEGYQQRVVGVGGRDVLLPGSMGNVASDTDPTILRPVIAMYSDTIARTLWADEAQGVTLLLERLAHFAGGLPEWLRGEYIHGRGNTRICIQSGHGS